MSKKLGSIGGIAITDFVPVPAKSRAPSTATSITIDISDTTALKIYGTADITYYFNSDTTKTFPIGANFDTIVITSNSAARSLTILNASAGTVSIQGM